MTHPPDYTFDSIEGNLEEIETYLLDRSRRFRGKRNVNANYLYSFKREACHCEEGPDGFVSYLSCPVYYGDYPIEDHLMDPDVILRTD
jgi:hypothetical protein